MKTIIASLISFCLLGGGAHAWYPHDRNDSLLLHQSPAPVGKHTMYRIRTGDTLVELARRKGLGYQNLVNANPGIDPWLPAAGEEVLLPYAFLPPAGIEPGITVNLPEYRIYMVWPEAGQRHIRAYPAGIGKAGWDTPTGTYEIVRKIVHPTWHPPASLRRRNPRLPARVPAGPENPLGAYWLGLSTPGYGIHGTNKPYGIGRRVSHGCLRLYPADIRDLFARALVGTPVRVIRQPIKAGMANGRLLLEVHRLENADRQALLTEALQRIAALPWQGQVNRSAVERAIAQNRGIPITIATDINRHIE